MRTRSAIALAVFLTAALAYRLTQSNRVLPAAEGTEASAPSTNCHAPAVRHETSSQSSSPESEDPILATASPGIPSPKPDFIAAGTTRDSRSPAGSSPSGRTIPSDAAVQAGRGVGQPAEFTAPTAYVPEQTCKIYVAAEGIVSEHSGAPTFHELKELVVQAANDLGPWSGDFPAYDYELTLLDPNGRHETVYLGRQWMRIGSSVAPLNDRISADRWDDLARGRRTIRTFPTAQLASELAHNRCHL